MPTVAIDLVIKDGKLDKSIASARKTTKGLAVDAGAVAKGFLKLGGIAAVAATAVGSIAAALGGREAIAAAIKQQEAINAVSTALKRTGEFSQEALQDLENFSSKLQDLTGVGDEVTLQMLSLAQAFGASRNQAKEVVAAAVELSAATNQDLESAVRQVSKTLGGFAGELGEVNPAIKELTSEQLKAGAAAGILLRQYSGSAAAKLNTFQGALNATTGRLGDLLEKVGDLVIKNEAVVDAIQLAGRVFQDLGEFVEDNSEVVRKFVTNALRSILVTAPKVAKSVGGIVSAISLLSRQENKILTIENAIASIGTVANLTSRGILAIADGLLLARLNVLEFYEYLGNRNLAAIGKILAARRDIKSLREELSKPFKVQYADAVDQASKDVHESNKTTIQSFDMVGGSVKSLAETINLLPDDKEIKVNTKVTGDWVELSNFLDTGKLDVPGGQSLEIEGPKIFDANRTKSFETRLGEVFDRSSKALVENFTSNIPKAGLALARAFGQITQGEPTNVVSGALQGLVSTFFGSTGGSILNPFIGGLTGSTKDEARTMAQQFADALPGIIEGLFVAIDAFVEAFIDRIDEMTIAVMKRLPSILKTVLLGIGTDPFFGIVIAKNIILAIRDEIFRTLIPEIAKGLTQIWEAITSFVFGLADFIQNDLPAGAMAFEDAFNNAITSLVDFWRSIWEKAMKSAHRSIFIALENLVNNLINSIPGASAIKKGGGGGVLSKIPKPFAEGGFVVQGMGARDTVPAVLSPGELVIDRSTGPKLRKFLETANTGRADSSSMVALESGISMIVAELKKPMTVATSINIDGRDFGEVLLALNRRGVRTA